MGSKTLEPEVGSGFNGAQPAADGFREGTVTVVLRFHDADRLLFLEDALFSLAIQDWPELEIVLAVQNGSEELIERIKDVAQHQPWADGTRIQIFTVSVEGGVDGRSRLLNEGIRRATGRYLAFLDDDDVVYQHAYSTLVARLRASHAALAAGGSRVARMRRDSGEWYVVGKDGHFSWGRAQEDLFADNFVPIHSYVIDRTRIKPEHLYFDESFSLLEDYDLLLRLAVTYRFDFKAFTVPVCEYRVRLDGSNSIPLQDDTVVFTPALLKARRQIDSRKQQLLAELPPGDRQRFCRPTPRSSAQEDPGHFVFRAAGKVHQFFTRHPWLENQCSRIAYSSWRQFKRLKSLLRADRNGEVLVIDR